MDKSSQVKLEEKKSKSDTEGVGSSIRNKERSKRNDRKGKEKQITVTEKKQKKTLKIC